MQLLGKYLSVCLDYLVASSLALISEIVVKLNFPKNSRLQKLTTFLNSTEFNVCFNSVFYSSMCVCNNISFSFFFLTFPHSAHQYRYLASLDRPFHIMWLWSFVRRSYTSTKIERQSGCYIVLWLSYYIVHFITRQTKY